MPKKNEFFAEYKDYFGAKHTIIKKYVGGWAPIMSAGFAADILVYVDGFSGPGQYGNGAAGSPFVFLKAIAEHSSFDSLKTIFVLCNELDGKRADFLKLKLTEALDGPLAALKPKVTVHVFKSTFCDFVHNITTNHADKLKTAAIFGFVDPFGYSTASIDSVMKLYHASPKCELLINLMSSYLNRFRGVGAVAGAIAEAVGSDELPQGQSAIAEEYEKELKKRKVKFTAKFGVCSAPSGSGGFTYHLVFAAHHSKALELMKNCMWAATVAQPAKKGAKAFQELFYCQKKALVDAATAEKKLDAAYPEARRLLLHKFSGQSDVPLKGVTDFLLMGTCLPVKVSWLSTMMDGGGIRWVLGPDKMFVTEKIAFGKRDYLITFATPTTGRKSKSPLSVAKEFFDGNPSFERTVKNVHAFLTSKVSCDTFAQQLLAALSWSDLFFGAGRQNGRRRQVTHQNSE